MKIKKSGKVENQIKIINLLRTEGPLSRKAIADKIRLTRASITQLTTELMEQEILIELGEMADKEGRVGRKEILVDVNEAHWQLLGIDIEVDMVNIGVSTIKGTTVAKTSFAFDTLRMDDNVEEVFLQLLEKQIKKLLGSKKVAAKKIFSCGIAMVGRKSFYDHYRLAMPPVLKNRAQIKDFVENTFKLDVYLENNVRALAMAESLFFPTEGSNSFMFVKIGPGLGSALVFSDELYRGVHGQAGEIGRSIVTGFYSQFQESQTVTLEEIISLDFIKEELKPYWNEFQLPYLFERVQGDRERLTMPEIYQALEYKEILIETLFRKKMRILAHRLYDYKNLLDLEEIYLFFSTNASKILSEYLITEMKQISNSLPTVTKISSLTTTASYLSGSAVAYIGHMENINELY